MKTSSRWSQAVIAIVLGHLALVVLVAGVFPAAFINWLTCDSDILHGGYSGRNCSREGTVMQIGLYVFLMIVASFGPLLALAKIWRAAAIAIVAQAGALLVAWFGWQYSQVMPDSGWFPAWFVAHMALGVTFATGLTERLPTRQLVMVSVVALVSLTIAARLADTVLPLVSVWFAWTLLPAFAAFLCWPLLESK